MRTCKKIGLTLTEINGLTLKDINNMVEAYAETERVYRNKREYEMHKQAYLTSLAVWNDKSFPKKPHYISREDMENTKNISNKKIDKKETLHEQARYLTSLLK